MTTRKSDTSKPASSRKSTALKKASSQEKVSSSAYDRRASKTVRAALDDFILTEKVSIAV